MSFDIKKELLELTKDIKWNFKGILDTENRLHEIPKNLNFQSLFEEMVLEKLGSLKQTHKIQVVLNKNIRSYPDIVLQGGALGNKVIALDVKTGRRRNKTSTDGFTLGSYGRYFRNPNQKLCCGGKYAYNDFSEHWAVCFICDWDENADTLHMISNLKIIVQEKWKLAGKTSGTGTTTAIGSIKDIDMLIKGQSIFKNEAEFLNFWRAYGN